MSNIEFELSDTQRAFNQGVKAGAEALAQLAELAGESRDVKLKYFWLKVGTELAQAVPQGGEAEVNAFVTGASARQPTERDLL